MQSLKTVIVLFVACVVWAQPARAAIVDYALIFDDDDFLTLPVGLTAPFTIEGWVKSGVSPWTHVGTTFDGSLMTIFYNGVIDRAVAKSPDDFLTATLSDVLIDSYSPGGSGGDVILDEVMQLNYAKIEFEYKEQKTGQEPGTVGYWNFNEGSGQVVNDLSDLGHHGYLGSLISVDANDPAWVVSDRSVVPEPATMVLMSMGIPLLFRRIPNSKRV